MCRAVRLDGYNHLSNRHFHGKNLLAKAILTPTIPPTLVCVRTPTFHK